MDPNEFLGLISMATARDEDLVRLGTIDTLASPATKATVVFDGEDQATSKQYFIATEDSLSNGDRVLLIRVGHSWLIMGRVASVSGETAGLLINGDLEILTTTPEIKFSDIDATPDVWFHLNNGNFYLLPDRDLDGSWEHPYPFRVDLGTDYFRFWYGGPAETQIRSDGDVLVGRDLHIAGVWFAGLSGGEVVLNNINEIRVNPGSNSDPSYTFTGATASGLYTIGDTPQMAVAGDRAFHFANNLFTGIGDNMRNLGTGSHRWQAVYAVDGTINTSDGEHKTDIVDSDLGLDFIKALRPRRARWKDGVRPHYVLIAQEVKQAFQSLGIPDFAGFIDPSVDWEYDEEDPELSGDEPGPLGLRYHEFVAPLTRAIQELSEQVEALQSRIEVLERRPA